MGRNLKVNCWDGESLKRQLSGMELGWDLNSALPVMLTELHSCKKGKWKERKWGAAQSRYQKWPLVPASRSRAALWSWDGCMVFEEPAGEPDRAVKRECVTHSADAWQALTYGNLWMVLPLTCTLDTARSKRVFWGGGTSKMHKKGKSCTVKGAHEQAGQSQTSLFCCVPYLSSIYSFPELEHFIWSSHKPDVTSSPLHCG